MTGMYPDDEEVDCREVLARVYTFLDNELEDADYEQVRQHIDDCAPCLREFGIEQEVKTLVARKCGCDPAPNGLREKVLGKLREVSTEYGHLEYRPD
ncbi:MAG: mycothiol system anti-sigma-R factor [Streptosporangiales bacterium]|nr:mycothiol system anti-sigma-R factor [Streptosporangiales bacterium]